MPTLLRSLLAVATGFVVIAILSIGTGQLLMRLMPDAFDATGRTDRLAVLLATIAYVGGFATFGCYLAARLAPSRPMRHAIVLGLLGLAFNVMGSIAVWDTAPAWYHGVQIALTMVWAWLGGRLRERELARSHGAPALAR